MKKQTQSKTLAPIFVVGTPRSGTTLVAKILGGHSHIFMPGETHFFADIYSRRKALGDPKDPSCMSKIIERLSSLYGRYNEPLDQERIDRILFADPDMLDRFKQCCKHYKDIFSFFMEIQMEHEGKFRWGNNVPRDIFDIDEILSFYPDAKILICVRDVRDFLISYRDRWKVVPSKHARRLKQIYHPVVVSMLWKSTVKLIPLIEGKVPECNLLVVKYEYLVQKTDEVVREICKIVDEEFEPQMLEVNFSNSSATVQQKGIFSTSVGRWRESLGNEDAYVSQFLTYKEMKKLGYRIEKLSVRRLKVLSIFSSSLYALYKVLSVTKNYHGPMFPYLARRVVALFKKKHNLKR